jgi:hypothetical protein
MFNSGVLGLRRLLVGGPNVKTVYATGLAGASNR